MSPGVIYQLKQAGNEQFSFPYISDKVTEVFGVPTQDLFHNAMPVFVRIHHEDIGMVLDTLATSKANLSEWNCDYRVVVNGELRWVSAAGMPEETADDAVLMYDIDHFKRVNDSYGHDVGDQVLVKISELVQGRVRACDMVARIGGEEIVVLLPDTELNAAKGVAEELRKNIAALHFEAAGERFKVTVTFGVTLHNVTDRTPDDILRRVDKLMYEGKQSGRNRVVAAT